MKTKHAYLIVLTLVAAAAGQSHAQLVLFDFESGTQGWGSFSTANTAVSQEASTYPGGGSNSLRIEIDEVPSGTGGAHWGSSTFPIDMTGYSTLSFWTRTPRPDNTLFLAMRDTTMGTSVEQIQFDGQITAANTWTEINIPLSSFTIVDLSDVSFINYKWSTGYTNNSGAWAQGDVVNADTFALIPEPSYTLMAVLAGVFVLFTRRRVVRKDS